MVHGDTVQLFHPCYKLSVVHIHCARIGMRTRDGQFRVEHPSHYATW